MDLNGVVATIYISVQLSVALFVSIIGAYHVRRCLNQPKEHTNVQIEVSIQLNEDNNEPKERHHSTETAISKTTPTQNDVHESKEHTDMKRHSFCKLWFKTVYKMRGVYGALAVHSFDVLTDVLVINQWLNTSNTPGDHVDPQAMAYSAIGVLIFSKILSTSAIYLKEKNIFRCILQLFDLLIFTEIYESHRKVVHQIKNKKIKDKTSPIESTLSFKYVRQMEAVFESVPESVLQLVYVMRSASTGDVDVEIFVISILQSIISMVNSITNNDYTRMQGEAFSKYKQRLPPTWECFKHVLCRLAEVIHRIVLLALLWTVCGGFVFGIAIIFELLIIGFKIQILRQFGEEVNAEMILLNAYSLIVIPSEEFYAYGDFSWLEFATCYLNHYDPNDSEFWFGFCFLCCINVCICWSAAACLIGLPYSIICMAKCDGVEVNFIPLMRICTSLSEFIFVIFWGIFIDRSRLKFLIAPEHGLSGLIISASFFLLFTQYVSLFPNFKLPLGVNIRSKWGNAYGDELNELQKIQIPNMPYFITKKVTPIDIKNKNYFDLPYQYQNGRKITPVILAMIFRNWKTVRYMEMRGAMSHKEVDWEHDDKFKERLPTHDDIKQQIETLKKDVTTQHLYNVCMYAMRGDRSLPQLSKLMEQAKSKGGKIQITTRHYVDGPSDFWDEPIDYMNDQPITAAVFALAQNNDSVIKWLESKGAQLHKTANLDVIDLDGLFKVK
eukprot:50333_1